MDADGLEGLEHLQGLAEDDDFDPNNSNTLNIVNMEGVLNGSERIEISHVGGELGTLEEDLEEDTEDEGAEAKARRASYLFIPSSISMFNVFASIIQKGGRLEDPPRSHGAAQPRIRVPDARHGELVHPLLR
jgi:hypothetical protein